LTAKFKKWLRDLRRAARAKRVAVHAKKSTKRPRQKKWVDPAGLSPASQAWLERQMQSRNFDLSDSL